MSTGRRSPSTSSHPVRSSTPGSRASQRGESIVFPAKSFKLKRRSASASKGSKPSSPKDSYKSTIRRIGEARPKKPEITATVTATKNAESAPAELERTQRGQPKPPGGTDAADLQRESPEVALDNRARLPGPSGLPQGLEHPQKYSATRKKVAGPEDLSSPESQPISRQRKECTIGPPSSDATSPLSTSLQVRGPDGQFLQKATVAVLALFPFLGMAVLLYLATSRADKVSMPTSCLDSDEDLLVETSLGVIRGLRVETASGHGARAFLGIPFGADVSAKRRFELAASVKNLSSPFLALEQGHACLQPLMYNIGERLPTNVSDDCLSVNVYTPSGCSLRDDALPVLFFITGWMSYTLNWNGMFEWHDLASRERVIVVAPNYRLGVIGFLNRGASISTSNLGVRDVLLAWQWTLKHIGAFGGDPGIMVPLAHASASVMMTGLLMRPELLNVRRAVLLSQSLFAPTKRNSGLAGLANTREVANLSGCCTDTDCSNISADEVVRCLSHLEPLQLVSELGLNFGISQMDLVAEPFRLGKQRMPQNRTFFQGMQLLMGSSSRDFDRIFQWWLETTNLTHAPVLEVAKQMILIIGAPMKFLDWLLAHIGPDSTREKQFSKMSEIGQMVLHHCPMAHYATEAAKSGAEVRYFVLDEQWQGPGGGPGPDDSPGSNARRSSFYSDELRLLSGSLLAGVNITNDQRLLFEELMDNVAAFARSGKPGAVRGVGEWPLRAEMKKEVVFLSSNGSHVQHDWPNAMCTMIVNLILQES